MRTLYPIFLDVRGALCLVVGGGRVALRRAESLLEAGARVRLCAPEILPEIERAAREAAGDASSCEDPQLRLVLLKRAFEPEDLEGVRLAFACTNSPTVNLAVATEAEARGVLLNRADEGDAGDFITPSVLRRGDLTLALSTDGASPLLAARLRRELERRFPEEYGAFVELLGAARAQLKERIPDPAVRRLALEELVEAEPRLLDMLREGSADEAVIAADAIISEAISGSAASGGQQTLPENRKQG